MRLDKLMEKHACGSRGQVKMLLRRKQVTVDGIVVTDAGKIVDSSLQKIMVSGKELCHFGGKYWLLNKPSGVVTARKDDQHKTVIDCLSQKDRDDALFPVGRLDRDTEGLVFLTTNGPIGFRMLHPKHHVTKEYYVEVNGRLGSDASVFFSKGVAFLDGTVCKPAQLNVIASDESFSKAQIIISEGKFHQIKKMFLAYGVKVTYLKRTHFGPFSLGELAVGEYRELTLEEKEDLKAYFD